MKPMSNHESMYLSPAQVCELYDQLRHLFDNNETVMEFSAYIEIVQRLSNMKERIHYCNDCAKQYFRSFLIDESPEYRRQCDPCKNKESGDE